MSLTIHQKLEIVQTKLKAPKGQRNNFGNYNYRSCEDIVEAVKPLLKEVGAVLILKDEIIQVGDRYYVMALAQISDGIGKLTSVGYAREAESRKGMDAAQVTGSASSYARKYALNGLLAIDDTKDADTMPRTNGETNTKTKKSEQPAPPETPDPEVIKGMINQGAFNFATVNDKDIPEHFEVDEKKFTDVMRKLYASLPPLKKKKWVWDQKHIDKLAESVNIPEVLVEAA